MVDRYTKKDAERCGKNLAQLLGKEWENCWKKDEAGKLRAKIGCWHLDYNPIYGGCNIEEIMNEGGGVVTIPSPGGRMKPYEFCQATRIVEDVVKRIRSGEIKL